MKKKLSYYLCSVTPKSIPPKLLTLWLSKAIAPLDLFDTVECGLSVIASLHQKKVWSIL